MMMMMMMNTTMLATVNTDITSYGIIKSKSWLAIATLKPTFTFLGILPRKSLKYGKSLPRKVKVCFRVAMASQPFDFIIPYEVIVSIHCRQHCCIHHHQHLRRCFYRGFQNLSQRTKSQQSHHDLSKILHIRIFYSPLCAFLKCLHKFPPSRGDTKSHWLHLFDFSPLCILK